MAMIARHTAMTGKKDAVRDEGDKSMVSTLEDMVDLDLQKSVEATEACVGT